MEQSAKGRESDYGAGGVAEGAALRLCACSEVK